MSPREESSTGARAGHGTGARTGGGRGSTAEQELALRELESIRAETRAEIGLLHDRVNALLAAEAFLIVGYAVTMSNGTAWGKPFAIVVAPVLGVLGLVLAVLAGFGVTATVRFVLNWTLRQHHLLTERPELAETTLGWAAAGGSRRRAYDDQRRSLLFFRAVPPLFTIVWTALTIVALTVEH